jgi:pyruvate kinase
MPRDPILDEAFSRRLTVKRIAAALGISTAAVSQWVRCPACHLDAVSGISGVPREALRPDLFPEKADAA